MVNLHHLPQTVRRTVAGHPVKIRYSFEKEILGTGGAIGKIRSFAEKHTLVVVNGKIYFEEDLSRALDFHYATNSAVTLVVVPWKEDSPFNPVHLDSDFNVTGFQGLSPMRHPERSGLSGSGPLPGSLPYVFTGIHILEPEALEFIPGGFSDTVRDVYPHMIESGCPVKGFVSDAYWCECSTLRRYLEQSVKVLQRKGLKSLSLSPGAKAGSDTVIGSDVEVPDSTRLSRSVLWSNIKLETDSSYRNVIITDGVRGLPVNSCLGDVVVTPPIDGLAEADTRNVKTGDGFMIWPIQQR
jgi:NDP-sugar pyrophosphorylase family protein